MSPTASQETQTSNLFRRWKNCWRCAKKPAKLNNLSVYSNKRTTFTRVKVQQKSLIHIFSGLN